MVPHVLEITRSVAPPEFELIVVPTDLSDEEWTQWTRRADLYLGTAKGLTPSRLERLEGYRLVQLMSVGYDQLDMATLRTLRIPLANSGSANAVQVAEYTVMLMLACLKFLCQDNARVHAGGWRRQPTPAEPLELQGKTVGLVGFGNIGQNIARRLLGWDVALVYYDVYRQNEPIERLLGATHMSLEDLLRTADIVSLHVPLSKATHRLINRQTLAVMKQGAIVINTSRGGVVDEEALYEALVSGRLSAAALDVFGSEPPPPGIFLRQLENVIMTPHTAGNSTKAWTDTALQGFANLQRVVRGERPNHIVPELRDLL
jgi:phosphoglycerate dehydrogenase-like enzyme